MNNKGLLVTLALYATFIVVVGFAIGVLLGRIIYG